MEYGPRGEDGEATDLLQQLGLLIEETRRLERERERSQLHSRYGGLEILNRPVSNSLAFSNLGLALGTVPTTAIALKFLLDVSSFSPSHWWFLGLAGAAALATGTVGYLLGPPVSKLVVRSFALGLLPSFVLLPLIGGIWGGLSGLAGGIFLFILGAIPGSIIGMMVGAVALPCFAILLRLLEREGHIDLRHLAPVITGISLAIAAFFLGL